MRQKNKKIYITESQLNLYKESILYHGTNNNFDNFDLKYCGTNLSSEFGYGIYLTTSTEIANNYVGENGGYIYHVEIPDDNGFNYLTYDKPITNQQYNEIISSLSDDEIKEVETYGLTPKTYGITAYNAISNLIGSDEETSQYLSLCGIIGMKYCDIDDDSIIDYVIYDEENIKIVNKQNSEDF